MMSVNMDKTIVLAVGEGFHLKRGKDRIVYAGMSSEDVYSIVQIKASGYQDIPGTCTFLGESWTSPLTA